jgi:hypothetical protein
MDVFKTKLRCWAKSDVGSKKISFVIAMEERFQDECLKNYEIRRIYKGKFKEIITYIHPNDIEGEVDRGKGCKYKLGNKEFCRRSKKKR